MTETRPSFSIVLPCYNEAASLPGLLRRYREVWQDLPAELILVNNGSTDQSSEVLKELLKKPEYDFARVVTVEVNRGYGHGIFAGLQVARGEFLAWSHADMQCPPEDLFRAYEEIHRADDPRLCLVKGRRGWRGLGAFLLTHGMSVIASLVLLMPLIDINAQPKVFHRSLLEYLGAPPIGFEFDLHVMFLARKAGFELRLLDVDFGDRQHGESKWAFSIVSRYRTIFRVFLYILKLRFHCQP
jgi:glycosyltransferase involved in cell wall biosynthesis